MTSSSHGVLKGAMGSSNSSLQLLHYNQTAVSTIDDTKDSAESFTLSSSGSTETLTERNIGNSIQEHLSTGSGISGGHLCSIKQDSLQGNSHSTSSLCQNGSNHSSTNEKLLEYDDSIRELRRTKTKYTRVTSEGFTALINVATENFRALDRWMEALTSPQQHLSVSSISTCWLSQIDRDRVTALERSIKQRETELRFNDTRMQELLEHMHMSIDGAEKLLLAIKNNLKELTENHKRNVWYLDDTMTSYMRELQLAKRNLYIGDDYGETTIDRETTVDHEGAY